MLTKEAIDALTKAEAITAANDAGIGIAEREGGTKQLALPDNFTLHDLERFMPNRRRARGKMTTQAVADFGVYLADHAGVGATVFVDVAAMAATAVLNLGVPDEPGHADDLAVYDPPYTAAYTALQQITANSVSQNDLAEWMEDWEPRLSCFDQNGLQIPVSTAVVGIRKITIERLQQQASSVQSLSTTTSALESVAAKDSDNIPVTMVFSTEPIAGYKVREFGARLSIITGEAKPRLRLRRVLAEQMAEEIADELAEKVREAAPEGMPVLLGSYAPKG